MQLLVSDTLHEIREIVERSPGAYDKIYKLIVQTLIACMKADDYESAFGLLDALPPEILARFRHLAIHMRWTF